MSLPLLNLWRRWTTPQATDLDVAFREQTVREIIAYFMLSCFLGIGIVIIRWFVDGGSLFSIGMLITLSSFLVATGYVVSQGKTTLAALLLITMLAVMVGLYVLRFGYWDLRTVGVTLLVIVVSATILPIHLQWPVVICILAEYVTLTTMQQFVPEFMTDYDVTGDHMFNVALGNTLFVGVLCYLNLRHLLIEFERRLVAREEMIRQREQMTLISTFIENASHEFRTPLATINTTSYLLSRTDNADKKAQLVERISDQTGHISNLVDSMLWLVKLQQPLQEEITAVNLNILLQQVFDALEKTREATQLQLAQNLDDRSIEVWAASDEIYLALEAVVKNAYQHTPPNGQITVSTFTNGDKACIEVKDTGVGMDEETLAKIFDHFYRYDKARSTRGIGLGLTIAQAVVERYNGSITVESAIGNGSTFIIELPLHRPTTNTPMSQA